MPSVLICSTSGTNVLSKSLLSREGVSCQVAKRPEDALRIASETHPNLILVDSTFPAAEQLIHRLRNEPRTRTLSVAVMARGDFDPGEVKLIEAGANAILRLPMGPEWDERLGELIRVPPRRAGRLSAELRFEAMGGSLSQVAVGTVLNLSEHGMLVEVDVEIPLGVDIDFKIHLRDDPRPLKGCGRVIRQDVDRRVGVRFFALESQGLMRVRRFVRG
jgi:DNA-binding response OmpR family regulator